MASPYANSAITANATTIATTAVIKKSQLFSNVTVSTSTDNAVNLPINASLLDVYTVTNSDANDIVQVFPGNAGSNHLNFAAGVSYILNPGCSAQFVAVSNTQASPPVIVWQEVCSPRMGYPLLAIAGAVTLDEQQSGMSFLVSKASAYSITLPTVANSSGVKYTFISGAVTANIVTITAGAGTPVQGFTIQNATLAAKAAAISITFTATSVIGDRIEAFCDGVTWSVRGYSLVAAGIA